jgi:hypothetical protein
MQEQLPHNKQRHQTDIDAAIMLASFIGAHSDEVPLSAAENGRVQSSAKEQARSTAEKLIISKQLHRPSNEKFPTTVRMNQSHS